MKKQYIEQNNKDKLTPEIYAELHMIFDSDIDVHKITQGIGIKASECQNKSDTKINPLTKKHNPGFWTFKTKTFFDYDLKNVLNALVTSLEEHTTDIKSICENHGGFFVFDFVITFCPNLKPAICFDKEFLKIVNFLNAEIHLDLYTYER